MSAQSVAREGFVRSQSSLGLSGATLILSSMLLIPSTECSGPTSPSPVDPARTAGVTMNSAASPRLELLQISELAPRYAESEFSGASATRAALVCQPGHRPPKPGRLRQST